MIRFALLLSPIALAADPARVQQLFADRCIACHGGASTLSGFSVASRESILKGGSLGVDVVPGDPAASRLYQFAAEGKMPPGKKLDIAEVELLRDWIKDGAPLEARRATREWWAFQTPAKPVIPRNGETNPIDAFLKAKLTEKGIGFSPEADPRTLTRRLHFDLTGLPPAPADYAKSYAGTVESLLASPRYGERWGRHWLDVVRFGETDGGEHNNERMDAWPYRDYVIAAINADKPYDQFVREQLAGDILHPGDPKMVAATGFLVAGPWDSVSAELNKDSTMKAIARMDELDDMVTTTAASFLGLTVNCARCHDHKFDPIPTRDYYRMAAVFAGSGFGHREVATQQQRDARNQLTAPIRKEMDAVRKEYSAIEDPVRTRLLTAEYQRFDASRGASVRRMPVNPVWNVNRFAPVRASRFRMLVTNQSGQAKPRLSWLRAGALELRDWNGAGRATADTPQIAELTSTRPIAVSQIEWSSDAAAGSTQGSVTVYRFEYLADDGAWTTLCSSLDHVGKSELDLPEIGEDELLRALPAEQRERRRQLVAKRNEIQARMDAIPELPKMYAVNPHETGKSFVLDRGSVLKPKEEVTPGALTSVAQLTPDLDAAERRLALAKWIAGPRNPLTARVIVNRVWYHHFGAGIVNTPSDFGFNGDRPSHPELLDYLATAFAEHGWSLKWLHRQIVNSRAYKQSGRMNEKAHAVDAGNRLLWRMPLKRMDAETLRDSILAVTGKLDLTMGGPGFLLQKKGDRGSYIYAKLNNDGPAVWRRAVYRFVVRGGERLMMDSFDCPDPSVATPQRSASNTPVQALTLLNNEFVVRQAVFLAERLQGEPNAQVREAHRLLYGREPTSAEIDLALGFLAKESLAAYARVLLNSNEFVYVP